MFKRIAAGTLLALGLFVAPAKADVQWPCYYFDGDELVRQDLCSPSADRRFLWLTWSDGVTTEIDFGRDRNAVPKLAGYGAFAYRRDPWTYEVTMSTDRPILRCLRSFEGTTSICWDPDVSFRD